LGQQRLELPEQLAQRLVLELTLVLEPQFIIKQVNFRPMVPKLTLELKLVLLLVTEPFAIVTFAE
jgi:hypothetical protein